MDIDIPAGTPVRVQYPCDLPEWLAAYVGKVLTEILVSEDNCAIFVFSGKAIAVNGAITELIDTTKIQ